MGAKLQQGIDDGRLQASSCHSHTVEGLGLLGCYGLNIRLHFGSITYATVLTAAAAGVVVVWHA